MKKTAATGVLVRSAVARADARYAVTMFSVCLTPLECINAPTIGIVAAATTAMMEITTSSSIRVNPTGFRGSSQADGRGMRSPVVARSPLKEMHHGQGVRAVRHQRIGSLLLMLP